MADNVYEGLFILDSNRYAKDPGGVSGKISELVEAEEGEVLASRLWAEQKLAYPINGHRKGTYWLIYFRMDSQKLTALNRTVRLNTNILRNLVLKVDPRLVDAMVSHASATPEAPAAPAPAPPAAPAGTAADAPASSSTDTEGGEKETVAAGAEGSSEES